MTTRGLVPQSMPRGSFSIPAISEGTLRYLVRYPERFAYRPVRSEETEQTHISVDDAEKTWTIHLGPAVRIRGRVLQQESNEPVADMLIDAYSTELSYPFSNARGEWSLWMALGAARDVTATPTLGQFATTHSGGDRFAAAAEAGEQQVRPTYLRRASSARGVVLDQQRSPIAGAVVVCERKMEEFWIPTQLYSGLDGSFRLLGVADGDTIRLSARSADMATERATTCTVSSTGQPELILAPQLAAQICGQVVDNSGAPVAGATVSVKKKVVMREEGNNFEMSQAENLLPEGSFVRTDVKGQFCFPASIDWQDILRIQITRHRYASFCTPWFDGRKLPVENGRIQLEQYCLLRLPQTVHTVVSVVDGETGQAVPGARVVFLGARTGKAAGTTDEHGRLSLEVKNATSTRDRGKGELSTSVSRPGIRRQVGAP